VHPCFDGNGRMGRLLMNLMVASGGWRWTLVTLDTRDAYMSALELASVYRHARPPVRRGKPRITMMLDNDLLATFRARRKRENVP